MGAFDRAEELTNRELLQLARERGLTEDSSSTKKEEAMKKPEAEPKVEPERSLVKDLSPKDIDTYFSSPDPYKEASTPVLPLNKAATFEGMRDREEVSPPEQPAGLADAIRSAPESPTPAAPPAAAPRLAPRPDTLPSREAVAARRPYARALENPTIENLDNAEEAVSSALSDAKEPTIREKIADRLGELTSLREKARLTFEKNQDRVQMADVLESIGQGLARLGAAAYGAKHGVDMSGVKFEKANWEAELDRLGKQYQSELDRLDRGEAQARGELSAIEEREFKEDSQQKDRAQRERMHRERLAADAARLEKELTNRIRSAQIAASSRRAGPKAPRLTPAEQQAWGLKKADMMYKQEQAQALTQKEDEITEAINIASRLPQAEGKERAGLVKLLKTKLPEGVFVEDIFDGGGFFSSASANLAPLQEHRRALVTTREGLNASIQQMLFGDSVPTESPSQTPPPASPADANRRRQAAIAVAASRNKIAVEDANGNFFTVTEEQLRDSGGTWKRLK